VYFSVKYFSMFERSQDLPVSPGKAIVKMKIIIEHLCSDFDREIHN
jgi:hypothetical protein